jgi:predicted nucleic acid-binding protein
MLLLDTNVVSEFRKFRAGRGDPNVVRWAEAVDTNDLFISSISLHELEVGVLLAERRDPPQGVHLRAWLETRAIPGFAGRILDVDAAVAKRAAKFHVPDPRPINDAFIAATALVHGMTLVTRNVSDFTGTGVKLINPWDDIL